MIHFGGELGRKPIIVSKLKKSQERGRQPSHLAISDQYVLLVVSAIREDKSYIFI